MIFHMRALKPCVLITFAGLTAFAAGCQAAPAPNEEQMETTATLKLLTEADDGTTVKLAAGSEFDIRLKGNPTTGYGWRVESIGGGAVAQKGDQEYIPSEKARGRVGVGGTEIFHFEVKAPGETKVKLGYKRPWEKKDPIQTFSVTIDSK